MLYEMVTGKRPFTGGSQGRSRSRPTTVSEWVRSALRAARRAEPEGEPARRLEAIRTASGHAFPTADIDQMLAEIARGRADADA